jgi:hypothetical protein
MLLLVRVLFELWICCNWLECYLNYGYVAIGKRAIWTVDMLLLVRVLFELWTCCYW